MDGERMSGGNASGEVLRLGRTVRKAWTDATPSVQALLGAVRAAGARRSGAIGGEGTVEGAGEALGRSQRGFSIKLHLRAEGGGKPMAAVLTAGERHEQFALDALMDTGAVRRPGRGRPRLRPRRAAGDRGYSSPPARRQLKQRRVEPVIPTRKDQPRQPDFDKAAYRERNKVDRLINRLKQYRRIATRYEKRAINYLAMVTLGMTMLWLT